MNKDKLFFDPKQARLVAMAEAWGDLFTDRRVGLSTGSFWVPVDL